MTKLRYAIFDALVNMFRRRTVNLIVAVSLTLGMLVPVLCLANINIFVERIPTIRYKNDDNMWIASCSGARNDINAIGTQLKDSSLKVRDCAFEAQKLGTVEINNARRESSVTFVSEDWLEFEECNLIEGSLDLFTDTSICLVEQMAAGSNGLRAGDKVTLFGDTYTVCGIISSYRHHSILLPLTGDMQAADPEIGIRNVYIRTADNIQDASEVQKVLGKTGISVEKVERGADWYHATMETGLFRSLAIFGVGFLAYVFAALNICLVLKGKINLDKRNYGIRMAIGAPYGLIFTSALIENILCFCIAYVCDIGLVYILMPIYPDGLAVFFSGRVFVAAFLFGSLMTVTVTWIILSGLKKEKLIYLREYHDVFNLSCVSKAMDT